MSSDHELLDQLRSSETETSMRRALGLGGQPAPRQDWRQIRPPQSQPQRRRFAQDGDVPVVFVGRRDQGGEVATSGTTSPPMNRLALAESSLKAEQESRQRAERALAEARATVRDLQTKIGHADLVKDEALAVVRRIEAGRQAAEIALAAERNARLTTEEALQRVLQDRQSVTQRWATRVPATAPKSESSPVKRRGRPLGSKNGIGQVRVKEPKPVKWW